ncbi:MAG: hypothetical protein QOJ59_5427 [Thermomicrobiales bacterium]|jgi:hypothetical protein|nr:hypothetical protein [Thermomicrobiales bacterium]
MNIPDKFWRQIGIDEAEALQASVDGDDLRIKHLHVDDGAEDWDWYERLYKYFELARDEAIEKGYTDEEINATIDAAVAAVRVEPA